MDVDADVAVIGSGLAGRMAALRAAETASVIVVTDGPWDKCNSQMAQGGLHAPRDRSDSVERMVSDIERSARMPVDPQRVRSFVDGAAGLVERLLHWGLAIDRDEVGSPAYRIAGGMSEARVLTVADGIGPPLLGLLDDRLATSSIRRATHRRIIEVQPDGAGEVVRLIDASGNVLTCRTVVVATGGGAFREARRRGERTTNPRNQNEYLYDALRARGAETVHDDLWQFQPFGLVEGPAGPPGRSVPETVTSLGVRLLDRFGCEIHPLPADRLSVTTAMMAHAGARALHSEGGWGYRLTLSDLPTSLVRERYPKLARTLRLMDALGTDVLVAPFLHYQLGGLRVDPRGMTTLPGVFAAGEVTGGLHGRNRLMGAGVTDALVHGWASGEAAATEARQRALKS